MYQFSFRLRLNTSITIFITVIFRILYDATAGWEADQLCPGGPAFLQLHSHLCSGVESPGGHVHPVGLGSLQLLQPPATLGWR